MPTDTFIAELLEADQIVIGTPMYNFAVPAVVKAWKLTCVGSGRTHGPFSRRSANEQHHNVKCGESGGPLKYRRSARRRKLRRI
jgi:putative NADPH-quinone reductase